MANSVPTSSTGHAAPNRHWRKRFLETLSTTSNVAAAAGTRSVSVSAAGIFLGSAAENTVRTRALDGTLDEYELSFEDGAKLRGKFLVQRLDYAGDFNGERSYTLQLESSGAVVAA